MAALSGFYESHEPFPLGNVRSIVPLHRHGHQNGQQSGHILLVVLSERLALDLLHQSMMAIEVASDRGACDCCKRLFNLIKT